MSRAAIYSRQSKEKEDSLSIESQEVFCASICKANGWEYDLYKDPGLSGGDIERPDFQRMMDFILAGKYQRIMVYRLDRVNRDMADFANMLKTLERHNVIFQSATEPFDTSTPFGRAWAYNTMNYAEMERRQAMERGKENFLYRVSKGHYPGGNNPFGYKIAKIQHDGKAATTLEPIKKQAVWYGHIFDFLIDEKMSLRKISIKFNQLGILTSKGCTWTGESIRRLIKNPLYAENTIDMFEYFVAMDVSVMQGPDAFDGQHGLLLVEKEVMGKHRHKNPLNKQHLSVGLHPPLISATRWLHGQRILDKHRNTKRRGTGKRSWLVGFMKCAHCGLAITMKYTKRPSGKTDKYFVCSGHAMRGNLVCTAQKHHVFDEVEKEIEKRFFEHVHKINLDGVAVDYSQETKTEINTLKAQDIKITQDIDALIDKSFEGVTKDYVQNRIESLDTKRKEIHARLAPLISESPRHSDIKDTLKMILGNWDELSIPEKYALAENIISSITLSNDMSIDIAWII